MLCKVSIQALRDLRQITKQLEFSFASLLITKKALSISKSKRFHEGNLNTHDAELLKYLCHFNLATSFLYKKDERFYEFAPSLEQKQ